MGSLSRMLALLVCLFVLPQARAVRAGPPAWSDADYARYDFHAFAKLPAANRIIDVKALDLPLLHAAIFFATNAERQKLGLAPFRYVAGLQRAAARHALDMVEKDFFSHMSPVRGRQTLRERLAEQKLSPSAFAENIATQFVLDYTSGKPVYSPEQNGGYFSYQYRGEPILNRTYVQLGEALVRDWMNSPGHRRNIVHKELASLGCGAALFFEQRFHGMPSVKAVQNFGD